MLQLTMYACMPICMCVHVFLQVVQASTSQRFRQLDCIIIDMATYFNNSEVHQLACKAIRLIAEQDAQAGDYLGKEGACEAVIAAIWKHSNIVTVVTCGVSAVLALAQCKPMVGDEHITRLCNASIQHNTSNTARLIQAGVHISVNSAITQHMSNAELVMNGTLVLYWLSHHSTTHMKTTMGIDGVCEVLASAMGKHINNSDIVQNACMTVQHLATDGVNQVKLGHCGMCEAVVDALKAYGSDEGIAKAGCEAIHSLAQIDGNRAIILSAAGVCEALLTIMQQYSDNTVVLLPACKAMSELANESTTDTARLIEAGVHISVRIII
jgi:hypothetical protein